MKNEKKRKVYKKRAPSLRQKRLVKNILENKGSLRKAIKNAGYSQAVADNPQQLLRGKNFQELISQVIPESMVANLHKELLEKKELVYKTFPEKMSDHIIKTLFDKVKIEIIKIYHNKSEHNKRVYFAIKDEKVVQAAIDMYYKVKGSYAPIKIKEEDPMEGKTDDELLDELEKIKELRKRLKTKE